MSLQSLPLHQTDVRATNEMKIDQVALDREDLYQSRRQYHQLRHGTAAAIDFLVKPLSDKLSLRCWSGQNDGEGALLHQQAVGEFDD